MRYNKIVKLKAAVLEWHKNFS